MNTAAPHIVDTSLESFEQDVIVSSMDHLVMVDFWADWCGPCKSLSPILDKLVAEFGGALRLAKINTDQHQDLAMQFGIRSLPTVVFFHQGKPVDQFMGVQPESAIRQIVEKYVSSESDSALAQAIAVYEAGDQDTALQQVAAFLAANPSSDEARITLANWLLDEGNNEQATELLEGVSEEGRNGAECRALQARLEFAGIDDEGPQLSDLQAAVNDDGNDLDARFQLAGKLVAAQQPGEALEQLLEIIRRDQDFRDGEARQTMLKVFELCGGGGELVQKYRRALASALN